MRPRCLCRLSGSIGSRMTAVAAGRDHTLALTACGIALATGCNNYGALGTGNTVSRSTFLRVPGLPRVLGIAAGESHSAAVANGGVMYMFGRGDWGQLGLGDVRTHWLPTILVGHHLHPAALAANVGDA